MNKIAIIGAGMTMGKLAIIQERYPEAEIHLLAERIEDVTVHSQNVISVPIKPHYLEPMKAETNGLSMRKSDNQPWKKSWKR